MTEKYNWETYLKNNLDLAYSGITTEEIAIQHFIEHGMYEKRKYFLPDNFDWKIYLLHNQDLSVAGITTEQEAILHYLRSGKDENRICGIPEDFDWKLYLLKNKDLPQAGINTEQTAIEHYLTRGWNEKREYLQGKKFEWEQYIIKNPDLVDAGINSPETALHHYFTYGIAEGRVDEIWSPHIYLIGGVNGGGSLKFASEFMQNISYTKKILTKFDFDRTNFKMTDILIVQHLFADITPEMICEVIKSKNCRLMINIHDFWWFNMNKPHCSYLEIINIPDNIRQLFNAAELIIHPSQFTFAEYSKHFSSHNFIVSPHTDYSILSSTITIPPIIDSTIRIGCLHEFTECKGAEYITYLQNKYKIYRGFNIEFLITGVNTPPYNENEFFTIIKNKGLHCLFLLNKWGETYCYSLSKYLKSGLPILYNSIGAVAERVPDISAYKYVFSSVVEFNENNRNLLNNKFTEMLDFIIAADKKPLPSSIDTTLSLPPLYDSLFKSYVAAPDTTKISNHDVQTIFILSSSIIVNSTPLSYTPTRSIFSGEERFQQTIKCIKSIRNKVPKVAIFLVDPTPVPIGWRKYLELIVDKYINCADNRDICQATSVSPNKGVAECKQILAALDFVAQYPNITSLFKITGRYALTHSFDIKYFSQQKVYFKRIPRSCIFYEPVPACYTCLYRIPICYLAHFRVALQKAILIGNETSHSVETILPFQFDPSIVNYDAHLGVSGWIGPSGIYLPNIV
jgi:hypothetical protein